MRRVRGTAMRAGPSAAGPRRDSTSRMARSAVAQRGIMPRADWWGDEERGEGAHHVFMPGAP